MSAIQQITNASDFQKLLTTTDKLIVVDFFATWW
jgi:hypothetical protein